MTTPAKPKAAPRGRPFAPGQSGNPAGRPRGARNKATLMVETIVEARLNEVAVGAVARALAGDAAATRLVLKPYLPRRPLPEFDLGEIETASDVRDASAAVLHAATTGVLDAQEAFTLHRLVEARARLLGYVAPDAPPPQLQLQFEPRQPGEAPAPDLTVAAVERLRGGDEPERFDVLASAASQQEAEEPPPTAAPEETPPEAAPPAGRRIVLDAPGAMRVREIRPWLIGQGLEPTIHDVVEPNRRTADEPVIDRIEPHRSPIRESRETENCAPAWDPGGRKGAISNPVFSAENS